MAETRRKALQLGFAFAMERRGMAMPVEFIGASLFSALNRSAKPIHYPKVTELSRMNGYRLSYKGRVLTQAHADIWLAIVEIFKRQQRAKPHTAIEFHASQLLRVLGKPSTAESRASIWELVSDMMACMVRIVQPGQTRAWAGAMVFGEVDKNDSTGETRYRVMLHPTLCEAYERGFTSFEWMERKAIGKNELALWLHQYVLAFPKPVPVAELQELSWQGAAPGRVFRNRLRIAADNLVSLGILDKWVIDREGCFHMRLLARDIG